MSTQDTATTSVTDAPPELIVERRGDVDIVTINRPEMRNALRFETYDKLEAAVRTTTARCMVITGADPAFCSGDDVRAVMGGGEKREKPLAVAPRLTPAADALLHSNVPVVAAVNGAAVGWGMELSMMADIRVASEKAKFGELFVLRGLCTDVAGIGRLATLVGREVAAELLFTGDVIDAATAAGSVWSAASSPTTRSCRRRSSWPTRSPRARRSRCRRSRRACAGPSTRTGASSGCGSPR